MASSIGSSTDTVPGISDVQNLSRLEQVRLVGFGLVVLGIAAMAALVLGELLSLLVLGWTADVGAELGIHRLHVMVIATVILTTLLGVFVQLYRPTRQSASMVGALVSIVLAGLTQFVGEGSLGSVVPFLVLIGLATLLHPAGRQLLRREQSYSPAMLAFVVVAAIPLVAFAAAQVGLQVAATDSHAAAGHYTGMAQLGLLPLAYAFVAAIRIRGWRVAAWIAALPIGYYGLLAMSFPTQQGSRGVLWGAAAILWAVGFIATTEYSRLGATPTRRRTAAGQD